MYAALLKKHSGAPFGQAPARFATLPAPIGGWNARDAVSAMKPEDALVLENIIPGQGRVRLRPGYLVYATGITGVAGGQVPAVETLMEYAPPSGLKKLFAACGTGIYDASSPGGVPAAVQSGLTSARWASVMMASAAGTFLCAVNGSDHYRTYNGSAWTDQHANVTGVDTTLLSDITVHANRLWFIEKNSMNAWYLGVSSISGAASKFPMGSMFKQGGKLIKIATWTVDGGDGMDDKLVFISDRGEVAVYQGTDPTTPSAFQLVGVFRIAEPIGDRCTIKVGGDLGVITSAGVALMAQLLGVNTSGTRKVTITNKISGAFQEAYDLYGAHIGWQVIEFPSQSLVLINVPVQEKALYHQYVINVETGSWCKFTGINACSWSLLGERLMFGSIDGKTYEFGQYDSDDGRAISWSIQTAFDKCGVSGNKVFKMVRPLLQATPGYVPGIAIKTDWDTTPVVIHAPATAPSGAAFWDTADWDLASWGVETKTSSRWRTVSGEGSVVSVALQGSGMDIIFEFNQIDILFEAGGSI